MSHQLTYVLITPYSLIKSRTGNIIARLMSFSGCDLVGIRMICPSDEFVREYIKNVKELGIKQMLSAPRSPWQTAYVERLIGSIRRECLDHAIVFGERSLGRTLAS